jgi:small subunit ribosomal protein S4e
MHMKRQTAPKSWPIKRKGTAYVVRPSFGIHGGVPVLIILRDMLKLAKNRKEVKRVLKENKILLNGKAVKEEKNSALLFDVISIVPSKESYRIDLSNRGKFILEKIKDSEKNEKISKVINKKTLKKGKMQINLSDGRNFLSDTKCKVHDSLLINFTEKKIAKVLPMEEGREVIVFAGKHSGARGKIEKLNLEEKSAQINKGKEKVAILIKQLMVIQ